MKECRAAALRDPAFSVFWEGLVALKAELARPSTNPDQKRKSPEASAALAITNCLKSSNKLPVPEWVKKLCVIATLMVETLVWLLPELTQGRIQCLARPGIG